MRIVIAIAAVLAGGCEPLYTRGFYIDEPHAVGCLDVALYGQWPDAAAGPVVYVHLGNRCERSVVVDLREMRVTDAATGELLALYDPRHEVRPVSLIARGVAGEQLEYHPRDRHVISAIYVTIGAVVDGETASGAIVHLTVPPTEALAGDEVVR